MKNNFFDRFMENNIQHTIISVPVEKIQPSRYQPRLHFDEQKLDELSQSIQQNGLIQPLTVRKVDDGFELIAGERRLQAATQLGWTSINANIVDNLSEIDQLEMEIEENNQRKEFTDAELMEGYKRLQKLRNPGFFYRIYLFFKHLFHKIADAFNKKN